MRFQIKDAIKSYSKGQDKLIPPQKTIQNALRALYKIKPPILVKIKRNDEIDRIGIPIHLCDFIDERIPRIYRLTGMPFGKGVDWMQAKASLLMELIERVSCYGFLDDEKKFKTNNYSEIKKGKVALKDLILSLPETYRKDDFISKELKEVPLEWTDSFSLTENRNILFPLRWFYEFQSTNGFAAGNSIEEAILQGLCEVIERHAISTITQGKLTTPTINIDSINDRIAKAMILKLNKAGIKLYIKDFSLGFGIPTVGVLAYDTKTSIKHIKIRAAAGTSLNRNTALIRALMEVVQNRIGTLLNRKRKNWTFPNYKSITECEYILNNDEIIKFSNLPTYSNKNFKKEIEVAVEKLKNNGFKVIVTNVTHNILKISAVIVTVPGSLTPLQEDTNPYLILLQNHRKLQNYQENIKIFERYFKLNPEKKKKISLLYSYGLHYKKLRKYNQAIKIFNEAASFGNKNNQRMLGLIYKQLISCYLNLSKPNEVFRIYKRIRRLYGQG